MSDNDILSIGQIKEALKDKRLYVVAESTGLSYPTIKKLADGKELNYTVDTLKAISKYVRDTKNNEI